MKSLKERWDEQKASDYNVTPPKKKYPEYTFSKDNVSDEERESFKKMVEESNKQKKS